jgi:acyl-CoA thioesterase
MERTGPATLEDKGAATRFDRTTTVHLLSEDGDVTSGRFRFAADLDESWASLRGVHGGYVTSLTVRAAEAIFPDRDVRTVAASFLRPTAVGPAAMHVGRVRSGRSFGTVMATVRQDDRDVISSRITMLGAARGAGWSTPARDRPAPLRECVSFTPPPEIRHFSQADLLVDPATLPTGDAGDARIAGHVRPKETRPFDAAWLVMIGDWFPPSPFRRLTPPTGGVSIDYTVHVHQTLPASTDLWLEGVFRADTNVDGIALEHGTLSHPDGTAIAETFHTRWTG